MVSVFNNLIASNRIARLDRLSLLMRFDEMRLDTIGLDLIESHRAIVSRPYDQIIDIKMHGSRSPTSVTSTYLFYNLQFIICNITFVFHPKVVSLYASTEPSSPL